MLEQLQQLLQVVISYSKVHSVVVVVIYIHAVYTVSKKNCTNGFG